MVNDQTEIGIHHTGNHISLAVTLLQPRPGTQATTWYEVSNMLLGQERPETKYAAFINHNFTMDQSNQYNCRPPNQMSPGLVYEHCSTKTAMTAHSKKNFV